MLRQFKGLKWINNVPNFILYNYENNIIEYRKVEGNLDIKKSGLIKCNGYYDLTTHKYVACPNFNSDESNNIKQCEKCANITGFKNCLGCDGTYCRATNSIAKHFCNQKHVVYIAMFGNNKFKVGTAAKYRKYSRILEQGAIASMFIAETENGRQARLIEHIISNLGYVLQVNSSFKLKNLIIDKERNEIENIFNKNYSSIIKYIPDALKKFFITPEFNYYEKVNKINKNVFLNNKMQLSLFEEITANTYDIKYLLHYDSMYGKIVNIIGTFLVLKFNNSFMIYDTKELEGCIVIINFT